MCCGTVKTSPPGNESADSGALLPLEAQVLAERPGLDLDELAALEAVDRAVHRQHHRPLRSARGVERRDIVEDLDRLERLTDAARQHLGAEVAQRILEGHGVDEQALVGLGLVVVAPVHVAHERLLAGDVEVVDLRVQRRANDRLAEEPERPGAVNQHLRSADQRLADLVVAARVGDLERHPGLVGGDQLFELLGVAPDRRKRDLGSNQLGRDQASRITGRPEQHYWIHPAPVPRRQKKDAIRYKNTWATAICFFTGCRPVPAAGSPPLASDRRICYLFRRADGRPTQEGQCRYPVPFKPPCTRWYR